MKRYLEEPVKADLNEKMVFLGGPRQVGKTTLAKNIAGSRPPFNKCTERRLMGTIFSGISKKVYSGSELLKMNINLYYFLLTA